MLAATVSVLAYGIYLAALGVVYMIVPRALSDSTAHLPLDKHGRPGVY